MVDTPRPSTGQIIHVVATILGALGCLIALIVFHSAILVYLSVGYIVVLVIELRDLSKFIR
jgi:hypothetical protein